MCPQDHAAVPLIYDIMTDRQRKDFEECLETDFSFDVPGVARFRVNAFNQNRGAGAVFRTIPSEGCRWKPLAWDRCSATSRCCLVG